MFIFDFEEELDLELLFLELGLHSVLWKLKVMLTQILYQSIPIADGGK